MSKLTILEHGNQRVLTTKVIAERFGTSVNNITANFNRNESRFKSGKHYFKLEGASLAEFKNIMTKSNDVNFGNTARLMLWTERGVARHAKILETDEAWEVYEELEETYFKVREAIQNPLTGLSKELQAIFTIDRKQQEIETRVDKLENTMTIDYTQQETLRQIANRVVITALGGQRAPAYKIIGGKAFAEMWRSYKRKMQVNSYKNTATKDYEKGQDVIATWVPDVELKLMIIGANAR